MTDDLQETYHFIGYVPAHGRIWELDGLRKSGPLEVGELPGDNSDWMDVVRPALRMRMQRYLQGQAEVGNENIRYNLLAVVNDAYLKASDELEFLKRERQALERRLNEVYSEGWHDKARVISFQATYLQIKRHDIISRWIRMLLITRKELSRHRSVPQIQDVCSAKMQERA